MMKDFNVDVSKYDFTDPEGRAKFISENKSSIYEGKNIDGENILIHLEQNEGMIVKTRHHSKPNWWQCFEYDKDGYLIGEGYEPNN